MTAAICAASSSSRPRLPRGFVLRVEQRLAAARAARRAADRASSSARSATRAPSVRARRRRSTPRRPPRPRSRSRGRARRGSARPSGVAGTTPRPTSFVTAIVRPVAPAASSAAAAASASTSAGAALEHVRDPEREAVDDDARRPARVGDRARAARRGSSTVVHPAGRSRRCRAIRSAISSSPRLAGRDEHDRRRRAAGELARASATSRSARRRAARRALTTPPAREAARSLSARRRRRRAGDRRRGRGSDPHGRTEIPLSLKRSHDAPGPSATCSRRKFAAPGQTRCATRSSPVPRPPLDRDLRRDPSRCLAVARSTRRAPRTRAR